MVKIVHLEVNRGSGVRLNISSLIHSVLQDEIWVLGVGM